MQEEDAAEKEKSLNELNAALAESLAYEESKEDFATMRRVRLEDAEERRKEELTKLNELTLEKFKNALANSAAADLQDLLEALTREYAQEAKAIASRGPRGVLGPADAPLCRNCKEFHGLAEWRGLCSRCQVLALQPATPVSCAPLPLGVFKAFGRVFRRRRKLPAPPSLEAKVSGRRLLESRLTTHNKRGYDIKGDGACQFRAVSHQLFDDERHHKIVRVRAIDQLAKTRPSVHDCEVYISKPHSTSVSVKTVGEDFDAYLGAMKLDTCWGDALTLQACADVFRVRILLVTTYDSNFELVIEPEAEPALREIWIGFHSEMHYISVMPQ
ncbi:hypothetical protein CTAYLR_002172 [Chrysophaeum taylorii]|uniref:OTU domain-containing protein n=1 Tax=Chrysophaeum taylorii TaxID=2483200 RepID=A0AAD7UNW8_9STRA|nr:hypothetical protein CTAYLR_002172 [Chrysophaeum taylorii]